MYFHVNYLNSFVNVQHLMPGSWTKSKQNRMRDTTITVNQHLEAIMLVSCIYIWHMNTDKQSKKYRTRVMKSMTKKEDWEFHVANYILMGYKTFFSFFSSVSGFLMLAKSRKEKRNSYVYNLLTSEGYE